MKFTLEDNNIVISVLCGNIEIGSHKTGGDFIKVKLISNVTFHINNL